MQPLRDDLLTIKKLRASNMQTMNYMMYRSCYVRSPRGFARSGRFGTDCIQSQYLSKVHDIFPLCRELAGCRAKSIVDVCNASSCSDRRRFFTTSFTPSATERARMTDWLCNIWASGLPPLGHSIYVYLQALLFFLFCWHSLLVLQINLLIFHRMLWW